MHDGEALKTERERHRLSQQEVANEAGIGQASLSRAERSRQVPPDKWNAVMAAISRLVGRGASARQVPSTPDAPPRVSSLDSLEHTLLAAFDPSTHTFADADTARTMLLHVVTPDRQAARRVLDAVASARRRLNRAPTAHEVVAELVSLPEDESGKRARFG